MPHLDLEYSSNVVAEDMAKLAAKLHGILVTVADVEIENCKTRWRAVPNYHIGEGGPGTAFVHLTIRLLTGRPSEVRRDVAQSTLNLLRSHLRPPPGVACQYTVDIGDIDAVTYAKHPPGTLSSDAPAQPPLNHTS